MERPSSSATFGVKLIPALSSDNNNKGRSFTLVPEDLFKLSSNISSITLRQLKAKLPAKSRFCYKEGEEVDDTLTIENYVKYSSEKPDEPSHKDSTAIKFVKIWYLVPALQQGEANRPAVSANDVIPQQTHNENNSQISQSTIYQRGQLQTPEQRGKLNEQSIQEMLQKIGGDPSQMSMGDFQASGLRNMTNNDWSKVEKHLGYLYGYYPSSDKKRFLKASYPAFKTFIKTDRRPTPPPPSPAYDENGNPPAPLVLEEVIDGYVVERQIPTYHTSGLQVKIDVQSYRSAQDTQYAVSGFNHQNTQIALGVATPKVQVGLSGSHDTTNANAKTGSSTETTSKIIATWMIPVVEIMLTTASTEIHPDCKKRLEAMKSGGTCAMAQKFINDYGTSFSTRIVLGGKLHSSQDISTSSKDTVSQQETKVRTAVNASISGGPASGKLDAKGNGGHSSESGNQSSQSNSSNEESVRLAWTAFGGEAVFAQNPIAWLPTVANFNNWQIIEHTEVKSILYAFDGYDGFEGTSAMLQALLSPADLIRPTSLPWTASMYDAIQDLDPTAGAIGHSFSSVDLTQQFRTAPFKIETSKLINEGSMNQTDQEHLKISWTLLKDISSVKEHVIRQLSSSETENGVRPLQDHLLHLDVSERSFTIVLEVRSPEMITSMDLRNMTWTKEALELVKLGESNEENKRLFNTKYGDRFITSWSRQRIITANFQISFNRLEDFDVAIRRFGEAKFSEKNVSTGLAWIKDLISRSGVQANVVICKSDWKSKGFEVKHFERINNHQWDKVYEEIYNIASADPIPIKSLSHSFVELLPSLEFPKQFTFTNIDSENSEKKRKKLINFFAEISSQSNLPILRYGSTKKRTLKDNLNKIIEKIKVAEHGMKGIGYTEAQVNEINGMIIKANQDLLVVLAACHWIRQAKQAEINLWQRGVNWLIRYATHMFTSDFAPVEADREKFGNDAVNTLNQLCRKPAETPRVDYEWSVFSVPDRFVNVSASPPFSNYKLVYWRMTSYNGGSMGGGKWWPYCEWKQILNLLSCHWEEERDLFIWNRNPNMRVERQDLFSYHWGLETWWLSDDDFPFDDDILWDFEVSGYSHKKGKMAFSDKE
ncbi:hypothetical protein I302_107983 [Kwoniella bestiolae CBS 10118]|uniref:MACPF domain-containing protein n=1 Tax=Kwoniella bestiolae CBS 10118 TaxID=1296100 RepID=A0A1B9FX10_9TREE|nr:hypothetical protein I302_07653 [Kwoniella bestiolae CBS 10118]OCF23299.1 hypothetical protein I302_07653 [Kwoniella bestiolae CBS 10118]